MSGGEAAPVSAARSKCRNISTACTPGVATTIIRTRVRGIVAEAVELAAGEGGAAAGPGPALAGLADQGQLAVDHHRASRRRPRAGAAARNSPAGSVVRRRKPRDCCHRPSPSSARPGRPGSPSFVSSVADAIFYGPVCRRVRHRFWTDCSLWRTIVPMTFDGIEVFARVVETGSFTAAAQALNTAKSSVSETVRALEERMGVRLLNRTTRRVRPTEAGVAFYRRCQRLIEEMVERTQRGAGCAQASRPAASPSRCRTPSPSAISCRAGRASSHAIPRWRSSSSKEPRCKRLVEEGIDLAIRIVEKPEPRWSCAVSPRSDRLVAAPSYLALHGEPARPSDLLAHNWSASPRSSGATRGGSARTTSSVRPRLLMRSTEGLRAAALAGLGIAAVPDWLVADALWRVSSRTFWQRGPAVGRSLRRLSDQPPAHAQGPCLRGPPRARPEGPRAATLGQQKRQLVLVVVQVQDLRAGDAANAAAASWSVSPWNLMVQTKLRTSARRRASARPAAAGAPDSRRCRRTASRPGRRSRARARRRFRRASSTPGIAATVDRAAPCRRRPPARRAWPAPRSSRRARRRDRGSVRPAAASGRGATSASQSLR